MASIAPLDSSNPKESQNKSVTPQFAAFVMNHVTGETVGYREFVTLDEALAVLNGIPRAWKFESTSGCSGERCGEGKCKGSACKIFTPKADSSTCESSCP